MYYLSDKIDKIKGIGPKLATQLNKKNIFTVKELLLFLPLRYEDRSKIANIAELKINELATIKAKVLSTNQYYKNRLLISSATIKDESGRVKCIWFNNPYIIKKLQEDQFYFFSGKINKYKTITQAVVEEIKDDTLHTGRLVPIYPSLLQFKQGSLRRILKEILDHLKRVIDPIIDLETKKILPFSDSLQQLHFPDAADKITEARKRLALEELLALIQKSQTIKKDLQAKKSVFKIKVKKSLSAQSKKNSAQFLIPKTILFELTGAQNKASNEILQDLQKNKPMNRLLIGDVGSGKTVVAGIACFHTLKNNFNACLIAPTQILAEQHTQSMRKIFPDLEIKLVTAKSKKLVFPKAKKINQQDNSSSTSSQLKQKKPILYIGTHALINHLTKIEPALVIYDEQHRFGVKQRSEIKKLANYPHILTMTATPIPRSLVLTIFSHLKLSLIDEMPKGRKKVKSWIVPEEKRASALNWTFKQLKARELALILCPFIEASESEAFTEIANTSDTFDSIKQELKQFNQAKSKKLKLGLLHGRLKTKDKEKVIEQLFEQKVNVLVTTPVVEVGVDLPQAKIIIIENAERFGLASLHQLRGRVGRSNQEAYCLLFSKSQTKNSQKRLKLFSKKDNGLELAELDLKNRGAGNIFGLRQHGFESLRFASWTNLELIKQAREIFESIQKQKNDWQSFFPTTETNFVSFT
ncbi:MAG: ATP-dependent DNA helicase RecG [Candidatus Woesebacteria bacterium]|jgi:ATP-dependent DNA helicase RecG